MTDPTRQDPPADDDRDAEELANEELPIDPAGPTEFGEAVE